MHISTEGIEEYLFLIIIAAVFIGKRILLVLQNKPSPSFRPKDADEESCFKKAQEDITQKKEKRSKKHPSIVTKPLLNENKFMLSECLQAHSKKNSFEPLTSKALQKTNSFDAIEKLPIYQKAFLYSVILKKPKILR